MLEGDWLKNIERTEWLFLTKVFFYETVPSHPYLQQRDLLRDEVKMGTMRGKLKETIRNLAIG